MFIINGLIKSLRVGPILEEIVKYSPLLYLADSPIYFMYNGQVKLLNITFLRSCISVNKRYFFSFLAITVTVNGPTDAWLL